jgi:hypothetical protein
MESKRGANFRKGSTYRSIGSPPAKEVKDGIKWNLEPTHVVRSSSNSMKIVPFIEDGKKDLIILEQQKLIMTLERKDSLRAISVTPSTASSTASSTTSSHYIPNMYSGTREDKVGRPLNLDILRKVASICCAGLQYTKYQHQFILNDEDEIEESKFYLYSKHVWWAAELVFQDSVDSIVKNLLHIGSNLAISFDGSWHKRGYTSNLGRFTVMEYSTSKILYGNTYSILESDYNGNSKGMESQGLIDFLDWSCANGILKLITIICCDKDTSIHKLVRDSDRCTHIKVLFDPGHAKKSFQGSLMKLFTTKKKYQSLTNRMSQFMMRCISETKSIYFKKDKNDSDLISHYENIKSEMVEEFCSRICHLITHYTTSTCSLSCPCKSGLTNNINDNYKYYMEISSILFTDECFIYIFNFIGYSKSLFQISYVCKHFYILFTSWIRYFEKSKDKFLLDPKDPIILSLQSLISQLKRDAESFVHPFHTCLVESSHNQCLTFQEKRVNNWKSYRGRTFCSYAKQNLGYSWISHVYQKLGITVSERLDEFITSQDEKNQKERLRQQSKEYKTQIKKLICEKESKKIERDKISKKKDHKYYKNKELYPEENKENSKKRKRKGGERGDDMVINTFNIEKGEAGWLLEGVLVEIGTNIDAYFDGEKQWFCGRVELITDKGRVRLLFDCDGTIGTFSKNLRLCRCLKI